MSSKLPTTTANTVIIEDILDVMSKWKSCQQYLEHKPHHAGNLRDAGWLRKQLEEDLLLPALKNSANDVKDANTKLKEWVSVVGVVNKVCDAGALRYEVAVARTELVNAVWDLEDTLYELRKKLRFEARVLNGVIDMSADDSSQRG